MKSAVWFFLGLVLGSAGGAYVAKSIAERKAEDEIEKATIEARDYYKNKYEKKEDPEIKRNAEEASRIYGKAFDIFEEKYNANVENEEHNVNPHSETYSQEITEQDFEDDEEYSKYFLNYYSNGVLTDEQDNVIDDPVHIAGDILDSIDSTNPIGYVRNDITKTDYEITYIDAPYEESGGVDD